MGVCSVCWIVHKGQAYKLHQASSSWNAFWERKKGQPPPCKHVLKEPVKSTIPFQPASVTSTQGGTTTSSSITTFSSSPAMNEWIVISFSWLCDSCCIDGDAINFSLCKSYNFRIIFPIQFNSPSFAQCFSPSYPMPFTQPTGRPFYVFFFISGKINVYAGCHRKYNKPAEAPYDLCIRHEEWHEFTTPGIPLLQRRFGNAYYHPY